MNALGRHILVEFSGCSAEILNDVSKIEKSMVEAAQDAGATVINSTFHHFSPFGVSGVVVIQESHLAIHTWPEYQYAAVDLFTCGDTVDPWISFDYLKKAFLATNHSALEMHRGSLAMLNRIDFKHEAQRAEIVGELAVEREKLVPKYKRSLWFTDKDENQALSLRYTGDVLFEEKSPFQSVRVFETSSYGKMLTIGSMVMCTERDEFHYHEMLTHPAFQTQGGKPKRVLVIGGGDGGTIREVLRYPSVEKVVMVEIDPVVVKASKLFLPTVSCEFENPKLDLRFEDGIAFVANAEPESYDVILVDGSDPVGPAEGLFSHQFFKNCKRALRPGGVVAAQGESPMFHEKTFVALHECMREIFGSDKAHALLFHATTYPSGMWSVQLGVKGDQHPLQTVNFAEIEKFSQEKGLKYYNEGVHRGSFSLPTFVKNLLNQ